MKIFITGIFLLAVIIFGAILTRMGKSYSNGIFAAHKIIALLLVVYTVIIIRKHIIVSGLEGLMIGVIVLLAASIISLFVTGAILSIDKVNRTMLKIVHTVGTLSLLVSYIILFSKLNKS